jgi:hypothetical protein
MEQDRISSRDPGAILSPEDQSLGCEPEPTIPSGMDSVHLPALVDPLEPRHPETSFTQTRHLRRDGWTPAKKRLFLERFAECGVIVEACQAAGMSARSAYNLRDRDPLFAAGWDAATVKAKPRLADEAFSRSMNGVVERIYRDGLVVAERHRYDNRLTMATLTRLDARTDRAEERGEAHLNVAAHWDEYLDAIGEDRLEDSMALLSPPVPSQAERPEAGLAAGRAAEVHKGAGDRELHELHHSAAARRLDQELDEDDHDIWEKDGRWWTDYPPPDGFDGEEHLTYRRLGYRRTLTAAEQAVHAARLEEEEAQEQAWLAKERARAEAQRDAWFGFTRDPGGTGEEG